jgi:hypothetical protein
MDDHLVKARLFAQELYRFREGIVAEDDIEQEDAVKTLVDLFVSNASAVPCALCANRLAAPFN